MPPCAPSAPMPEYPGVYPRITLVYFTGSTDAKLVSDILSVGWQNNPKSMFAPFFGDRVIIVGHPAESMNQGRWEALFEQLLAKLQAAPRGSGLATPLPVIVAGLSRGAQVAWMFASWYFRLPAERQTLPEMDLVLLSMFTDPDQLQPFVRPVLERLRHCNGGRLCRFVMRHLAWRFMTPRRGWQWFRKDLLGRDPWIKYPASTDMLSAVGSILNFRAQDHPIPPYVCRIHSAQPAEPESRPLSPGGYHPRRAGADQIIQVEEVQSVLRRLMDAIDGTGPYFYQHGLVVDYHGASGPRHNGASYAAVLGAARSRLLESISQEQLRREEELRQSEPDLLEDTRED